MNLPIVLAGLISFVAARLISFVTADAIVKVAAVVSGSGRTRRQSIPTNISRATTVVFNLRVRCVNFSTGSAAA